MSEHEVAEFPGIMPVDEVLPELSDSVIFFLPDFEVLFATVPAPLTTAGTVLC